MLSAQLMNNTLTKTLIYKLGSFNISERYLDKVCLVNNTVGTYLPCPCEKGGPTSEILVLNGISISFCIEMLV